MNLFKKILIFKDFGKFLTSLKISQETDLGMFALLLLQWKFPKNKFRKLKIKLPLFVLRLRSTTLNPLHHCFKQVIYTGLQGVSKKRREYYYV